VTFRLRANIAVTPDILPDVRTTITVTDRATGQVAFEETRPLGREWSDVHVGELPPGTFEVGVAGRSEAAPLSPPRGAQPKTKGPLGSGPLIVGLALW
jgi:hypothetical protein